MKTLEELSRRIATSRDLQSIVRTMKALSAVSVRQYENAAAALADYDRTVELGLRAALRRRAGVAAAPRVATGAVGAVVFGSDHGLCGRFNDAVAGFALDRLRGFAAAGEGPRVLAIGDRTATRLEALGQPVERRLFLPGSAQGLGAMVQTMLVAIDDWRGGDGVERVVVFHNRRTATATAAPTMRRLLPVELDRYRGLAREPWPSRSLPMFTMAPEPLLSALLRQLLFVSLYRAAAESLASEHASRLASMQVAERNIKDRLEEMSGEFRRRRQESITEEILDVVAGFEAMQTADDGGAATVK
jgi:F-type H+-transporting ATPase subunit gamma